MNADAMEDAVTERPRFYEAVVWTNAGEQKLSRKAMASMVEQLKAVWAVVDAPTPGDVRVTNIVGEVVAAWIDGRAIKAKIKLLDTPEGLLVGPHLSASIAGTVSGAHGRRPNRVCTEVDVGHVNLERLEPPRENPEAGMDDTGGFWDWLGE